MSGFIDLTMDSSESSDEGEMGGLTSSARKRAKATSDLDLTKWNVRKSAQPLQVAGDERDESDHRVPSHKAASGPSRTLPSPSHSTSTDSDSDILSKFKSQQGESRPKSQKFHCPLQGCFAYLYDFGCEKDRDDHFKLCHEPRRTLPARTSSREQTPRSFTVQDSTRAAKTLVNSATLNGLTVAADPVREQRRGPTSLSSLPSNSLVPQKRTYIAESSTAPTPTTSKPRYTPPASSQTKEPAMPAKSPRVTPGSHDTVSEQFATFLAAQLNNSTNRDDGIDSPLRNQREPPHQAVQELKIVHSPKPRRGRPPKSADPIASVRGSVPGLKPELSRELPSPSPQPLRERDESRETDRTRQLVKQVADLKHEKLLGVGFSKVEDDLIIHLKEDIGLKWHEMEFYFPHRTSWRNLQTRYSKKLKSRDSGVNSNRRSPIVFNGPNTDRSVKNESTISSSRPRRAVRQDMNYFEKAKLALGQELRQSDMDDLEYTSVDDDTERWFPDTSRHIASSVKGSFFRTARNLSSTCNDNISTSLKSIEESGSIEARNISGLSSMASSVIRDSTPRSSEPRIRHGAIKRSSKRKRPNVRLHRPYLRFDEREDLHKSIRDGRWDLRSSIPWQGEILHVDFTTDEVAQVCKTLFNHNEYPQDLGLALSALHRVTRDAKPDEKRKWSWQLQSKGVLNRSRDSIESFLHDVPARGNVDIEKGRFITLKAQRGNVSSGIGRALRSRELGSERQSHPSLQDTCLESFALTHRFKGASSDVLTVAWSPSGNLFAVGSAALTNPEDMQYNRPNNLLIGSLVSNQLFEFPEHHKRRSAQDGVNASHEMMASQDPLLFHTLASVIFSPNGDSMISGGHDGKVRIWENASDDPNRLFCYREIPSQAGVDLLAVNDSGLLATGFKLCTNSIRIFRYGRDVLTSEVKVSKLGSPLALRCREQRKIIEPTCLRWGLRHYGQRYLLGGFAAKNDDEHEGEVCLWDIESGQSTVECRNSRSTFDIQWSLFVPGRFALASKASNNVNTGTKSVVKIFDCSTSGTNALKKTRTVELECPALDINDLLFSPTDPFLLSVSCTDGICYVWDLRSPNAPLHRFAHGEPLTPLDLNFREENDTGIRFTSWDQAGRKLYTGSSDGIVALWNLHRAPEDALEKNVVQLSSGVMAGAFSSDYTNLLLGTVEGSVELLSAGLKEGAEIVQDFEYIEAKSKKQQYRENLGFVERDDTGRQAARELLTSGEIELQPCGDWAMRQAVQGPRYQGPYNHDVDVDLARTEASRMQSRFREHEKENSQLSIRSGNKQASGFDDEILDSKAWKTRMPSNLGMGQETRHFTCFACENTITIEPGQDKLNCHSCGGAWQIDILGFTQLRAPKGRHWGNPEARETDDEIGGSITNSFASILTLDIYHDQWAIGQAAYRTNI